MNLFYCGLLYITLVYMHKYQHFSFIISHLSLFFYFSISTPIFFAVPAMDFIIDTRSPEFISHFLRLAISSKSFLERVQILVLFGSPDHALRLSFQRIKFDVTGLPILRSKDLSA